MDQVTKKTFKTARGFTYTYYLHNPSSASKPTLVFCHGWPDNALLWAKVIPALLSLGHPLVVPDMLGYDGTSKPIDIDAYNSKGTSDDLYELVDSEGLDKIIPVGHDWGSFMAQRLYVWRPERCAGLIILNGAYDPPDPNTPFDLDATNSMSEKSFGYPCYAYWDVFAADDGPKLLLENVETLFHYMHWNSEEAMKEFLCTRGATRKLLLTTTNPDQIPLKLYAQKSGFKEDFLARMRRDGFEGPQNWYKALARNYHFEVEKLIPEKNRTIKHPCLYISSTEDAVCRTDGMERVKNLVPDLRTHIVQANHWGLYEKPEEISEYMAAWLKEKFP